MSCKILYFLDLWVVMETLSSGRKLENWRISQVMSVNLWHMRGWQPSSRVLTSDGEQDKTDLRPTCDCIHSFHEFAAELGPDRINMGREQWGVISLKSAWDLWS